MSRIRIFNIPIDAITMQESIEIIDQAIIKREIIHHEDVNASKIVFMAKDNLLNEAIVNCDIINADGQPVVWASKILGKPLPERVAGIDLMQNLVQLAHKKKYKVFFFGAKEEIVKKVVEKYSSQYSPEVIGGYRNGYFNESDEASIVKQIAESKSDMLFAALSSPKQEMFLYKYKDKLNTPFIAGVGGSFDVVSGLVKRAPVWMQNCGLEWFYRVCQEPRRMWKRYLVTNTIFIWMLLKEWIKK